VRKTLDLIKIEQNQINFFKAMIVQTPHNQRIYSRLHHYVMQKVTDCEVFSAAANHIKAWSASAWLAKKGPAALMVFAQLISVAEDVLSVLKDFSLKRRADSMLLNQKQHTCRASIIPLLSAVFPHGWWSWHWTFAWLCLKMKTHTAAKKEKNSFCDSAEINTQKAG
jgi:hypothetical protein